MLEKRYLVQYFSSVDQNTENSPYVSVSVLKSSFIKDEQPHQPFS